MWIISLYMFLYSLTAGGQVANSSLALWLSLAGGTEVVAIVTQNSVASLGLKAGVAATAVIKAAAVIPGVQA